MALFTPTEADACKVKECVSVQIDGTHAYYRIEVLDDNNHCYCWIDDSTAAGADEATKKAAMKTHLTTSVEKLAPTPVVSEVADNEILNTTIG